MEPDIHKRRLAREADLERHLIRKLSRMPLENLLSNSLLCKKCEDRGRPGEVAEIDAGESVVVLACWEEITGWKLFGLYHPEHADSASSQSPKPTALLRGEVVQSDSRITRKDGDKRYKFRNLELVDVSFPESLFCKLG